MPTGFITDVQMHEWANGNLNEHSTENYNSIFQGKCAYFQTHVETVCRLTALL